MEMEATGIHIRVGGASDLTKGDASANCTRTSLDAFLDEENSYPGELVIPIPDFEL